jgi:hypothetical protein
MQQNRREKGFLKVIIVGNDKLSLLHGKNWVLKLCIGLQILRILERNEFAVVTLLFHKNILIRENELPWTGVSCNEFRMLWRGN